ncbi:MAG: YihY family inner membrane protein, partial [Myxococcales bacterium]|nr:YihY family inner membrane protein [Myxococcales bacterium]
MAPRFSDIKDRLREWLLKPLDPSLTRKRTHPSYWLRLTLQIGRKWARDRCPQQAALLAFQTALSLVPLIAVSFALLNAINLLSAEKALADFIGRHVLPVSGPETVNTLIQFSRNVSTGALGVIGVVSTVVLAYMLFHTMESLFNDIWGVRNRRGLLGKFTVFYPLATLSPLLMGVSLYYTARFWRAAGIVGVVAPMFSTFIGFLLANKLLPKTRVSWRAAAAGSLVSVLLFEIAKRGFALYVDEVAFKSFKGIYGPLGLVPLLLIWIYYSWLVTLIGAEVAYTAQHLPAMEEAERKRLHAATAAEERQQKLNGRVAARLLV